MRRFVVAAAIALGVAATALAGDIVVPDIAWDARGAAGNLWSSEVYLINPTSQDLHVILPRPLPLAMTIVHPCDPPVQPWVVPAQSSLLVSADELNTVIGCPGLYVGGLVFSADAGIVIQTRMINHKAFSTAAPSGLLPGFAVEIPGIPASDLPQPATEYMLPALVWHPVPCGPAAYDTYLYLANPNSVDATVTFLPPSGKTMSVAVGGHEVTLPYSITVPANRTVQFAPQPPGGASGAPCGEPVLFDLFFQVDAPVAVIGTVVDRASNDARVVLPVAVEP